MKKIFSLLGVVLILSACKTYVVSTVASKNTVQSPSSGKFNMDNDSLTVSYSFAGPNMPLRVEIFNKLNEPLFVDWERSALVISENAYGFVDDKIQLAADVSSSSYDYLGNGINYSSGYVGGTAQISKSKGYIPPGAKITRSIYALNELKNIKIAKSEFRKTMMDRAISSDVTHIVSTVSFTEMDSPFQFKSFISIYTLLDNQPKIANYQHDFYVSRITKTAVNPSKLRMFNNEKDAHIVNGNYTGFAKTLMVVGAVGAVGVVSTLNEMNENK